ncbi:ABC-2 type transport system permease protein [Isoptericola sp. CG 20/1183]|uniref:Transport permease protein n=1 Tax=Isoptericola halotolerans TaxID=300560 RepID=A0ABX5ELZ7_9MICO|nr:MULTISPECIES: ABC transporter permease [Isoptericola]PRZ09373.1 ABC-2 type transport system permease protein [Isoptericola sp. CG 20/1183]PRZ10174.1 ABC-2 type transport system permease protein [Isoptericola halotolerans]
MTVQTPAAPAAPPPSTRRSPDRSTRRSAPLRDVATMSRREARRSIRSVDGIITAFALPVMIMVVFVVIFGGAISGGTGDYIDYVVPGVLVMCLGMNSATAATAVAQDMTSGTIDRFKTLPIFSPSALWGHVVASVVRNLASAVLVVAVALALGFRPDAGPAGWLGFVAFATFAIVTFTWVSAVLGLVMSVDSSQSVTMIFLFVPYLSSGFVPVETMPDWLHGFAENQPFTPIIETVRGLLTGNLETSTLLAACAWLTGFLAVSLVAGSLLYRRRRAR